MNNGIIHVEFVGFMGNHNRIESIVADFLYQEIISSRLKARDVMLFNSEVTAKRLIKTNDNDRGWELVIESCIRIYCLYTDFPASVRRRFRRLENITGVKVYFLFLNDNSLMPKSLSK